MKKTTSINLGGLSFLIEDEAYTKLSKYLESVRIRIESGADENEVMLDIEMGMAEKLKEKLLLLSKEVITLNDIEELILIMGSPEDFNSEKVENINEYTEPGAIKRLYRNPEDMIIGGVCGGMGAYFSIDSVFIRIIFIILIFSGGIGIPIYLMLWIITPLAETTAQKIEMKGNSLTIANIEKSYKESNEKEEKKKNLIIKFITNTTEWVISISKRVISGIAPIVRFLFGLGLIGISPAVIMAILISTGVTLSYTNSSYYFADIPISEIISTTPFYLLLVLGFLTTIIPFIFFTIAGISIIFRKKILNHVTVVIFVALWMISCSGLVISGIRYAPEIAQKIENNKSLQMIEKTENIENFKNITINGGKAKIKIEKGDKYSIKTSGRSIDLQFLSFENKNNTLDLKVNKREIDPKCLNCFQESITILITAPTLEKIEINNSHLEISSFEKEDIVINSKESDVIVDSDLNNLTINGSQVDIKINKNIENLNGELLNSSIYSKNQINIINLTLDNTTINSIGGVINSGKISLKNNSWIIAITSNNLSAEIDNSSGIYYVNNNSEADNAKNTTGLIIKIKEVTSIEFEKNEEDYSYFRFNDKYYKIENEEKDKDIYLKYRDKLISTF